MEPRFRKSTGEWCFTMASFKALYLEIDTDGKIHIQNLAQVANK